MKLIMAVVNRENSRQVTNELMRGGFSVTKLASTGGFMSRGSVTLLVGVRVERLNDALEIIKNTSASKKYSAAQIPMEIRSLDPGMELPTEITAGGATVFVLNIEQFEKY